jgi:hypothetical protein
MRGAARAQMPARNPHRRDGGIAISPIDSGDYRILFEDMHSFAIRLPGLEALWWLPGGDAVALRPPRPGSHIRTLITGVLVFMLAIGVCRHALSQEAAPQAASDVAAPPNPSDSPKENAVPPPSGPPDEMLSTAAPDESEKAATSSAPFDEVKAYLWSVYRRSGIKVDSHGEFTWKDVAAAINSGLLVEDYVIGGIDPDFRELLFAAGHAMDAAGVAWTILSAFRDDFRQSVAVGLKARVGNSFHGGSGATGGYGHGCAADLASIDRLSDDKVWSWLDRNGRAFDLYRPLRAADPAHVLPMAGWHELGTMLRNKRLGIAAEPDSAPAATSDPGDARFLSADQNSGDTGITLEQFLCIRPRPPENPGPVVEGAHAFRAQHSHRSAGHASTHDTKSRKNGPPRGSKNVHNIQTKRSGRAIHAASKR